ncbi:hypothetical protein DFH29DRAFT_1001049 [Suillus ampliporus]|nr:hypothetical protein DFH29DRAFT_1001049 [Suillus ampliporus]
MTTKPVPPSMNASSAAAANPDPALPLPRNLPAVSANKNRLDATVLGLAELMKTTEEFSEKAEKKIQVLCFEEPEEEIEVVDVGAGDGGDSRSAASREALQSKEFRDLHNSAFKILMGIKKLEKNNLPSFPCGKPDDDINTQALSVIVEYIRINGLQTHPLAQEALKVIVPGMLEKAVREKYLRMAREFREIDDKRKAVEDDDGLGDEDDEEAPVQGNRTRCSQYNSRAEPKLKARERKRTQEAAGQYRKGKYDAAFILNAMSEDEIDPNRLMNEPKQFVSSAQGWRSNELIMLYSTVDPIPDPDPDAAAWMKKRVKGPINADAVPPIAKSLKNRVHTWMVKPELLEEHPEWMTRGRVAANGVTWGEEELEGQESVRRKKRKASTAPKVVVKRKVVEDDIGPSTAKLEGRIEELLEGEEEDEFFGEV